MRNKNFLLVSFLLVIGLVLGGCGTTPENEEPIVETPSNEMRTVTVDGIEYEIPANPQRVIVYEGFIGSAVALNVPIVGAGIREGFDYSYLGDITEIENVGTPMSVEKVLELEPDLIVTYDADSIEQLQQIAPVVFIPYGYAVTVQEDITLLGEIFNRQEEAATWLANLEAEAAELKEKIAAVVPADSTFGLYEIMGTSLYVYGDGFGRGGQAIYNLLGLQAPKRIVEDVINGDQWMELSYEVLPEFAADFMFLFSEIEGSKEETLARIMDQNPIWSTLEAAQKNQIIISDSKVFHHWDPMAIQYQMRLMANEIIAHAEANIE